MENEKKTQNAGLIGCCCAIAILMMFVMFLRCKSCIRHRRMRRKQQVAQTFWYSTTCSNRFPSECPHFPRRQKNYHSVHNFTLFSMLSERHILSEVKRLSSARIRRLTGESRESDRFVNMNDYPERIHNVAQIARQNLAAGYIEYYKRQGRLPISFTEAFQSASSPTQKPPTLRQLYVNSRMVANSSAGKDLISVTRTKLPNGSTNCISAHNTCDDLLRGKSANSTQMNTQLQVEVEPPYHRENVSSGNKFKEIDLTHRDTTASAPQCESSTLSDKTNFNFQFRSPCMEANSLATSGAYAGTSAQNSNQTNQDSTQPMFRSRLKYSKPAICIFKASRTKLDTQSPEQTLSQKINVSENGVHQNQEFEYKYCYSDCNHINETKSCFDFKESVFDSLQMRSCQRNDCGVAIESRARNIPDVYLNPPSMSSLQSRGDSSREEISKNTSSNSFNSLSSIRLCANSTAADNIQRRAMTQFDYNGCNRSASFGKFNNICMKSTHRTFGDHFNVTSSNTEQAHWTYLTRMRNHNSGLSSLKRAVSLTMRSREPKSLGAELQSIMDKHYEMTGIRLTSTDTRQTIQCGFFDGLTQLKAATSKIIGRRQSFCNSKEIAPIIPVDGRLLKASSSMHIYRTEQKDGHGKGEGSILCNLTRAAVPCVIPIRAHKITSNNLPKQDNAFTSMKAVSENQLANLDKSFYEIHSNMPDPNGRSLSVITRNSQMRSVKSSGNLNAVQTC